MEYKTDQEKMIVPEDAQERIIVPEEKEEIEYIKTAGPDIDEINNIVTRLIAHGQQHPEERIVPEDFIGLTNKMITAANGGLKRDLLNTIENSFELINKPMDTDEKAIQSQKLLVTLKKCFRDEIENEDKAVTEVYKKIRTSIMED